jgi:hypothetical protein
MGFVLSHAINNFYPLPFLCKSHFRNADVVVHNSCIFYLFFSEGNNVFSFITLYKKSWLFSAFLLFCWLHDSLHVTSWQIIALSRSMPKALQSVEIWLHPRSSKEEPINNFSCHICAQLPRISRDLLLSPLKHFHCWPVLFIYTVLLFVLQCHWCLFFVQVLFKCLFWLSLEDHLTRNWTLPVKHSICM